MLFLIRTAFWLMIICSAAADRRAAAQRSLHGTAQAAVNDVATFCDRNPETCARGKDAFSVFVQKAQFGARDVDGSHQRPPPSSARRRLQAPKSVVLVRAGQFRRERLAALAGFARHAQPRGSRRGLVWARPGRDLKAFAIRTCSADYQSLAAPPAKGAQLARFPALSLPICAPIIWRGSRSQPPLFPPILKIMDTLSETRGISSFDEILVDFELLDDWEDRYRYVIELGRRLEPLPETERVARQQGARLRQPGVARHPGGSDWRQPPPRFSSATAMPISSAP